MVEDAINVPERIDFVNKYSKLLLTVSAVFYSYFLLAIFSINLTAFLIIVIQTFIGLAYSLFRIKKYFLLKNMLVAIVWGTTVLFVGTYFNTINIFLLSIFAIITLEFFINSVIFDIKDMKGDSACKIRTLPNTLGIKKTLQMCHVINTLSFTFLIFGYILNIFPQRALLLLPLLAYVYTYLSLQGKLNRKLYFGLFVDGEYIFTAFIIFLCGVVYG